jgi:hypothetical protein
MELFRVNSMPQVLQAARASWTKTIIEVLRNHAADLPFVIFIVPFFYAKL